MRGIEPPSRAWEARVLPLNHIRGTTHFTDGPDAQGGLKPCSRLAAMILSDRSIFEEIKAGRIEIEPFDEACVQPSSIDLHVDRKFRTFHNARYPFIDVKKEMPELTELVEVDGDNPFILHPGEFVLGSTLERVRLPDDLVARLEGKSSLGRLGLLIHSTAGYVDPGWDGFLTLELSNVANLPITIYPGMKIGQISFFRLTSPAERPYGSRDRGSKYQGQRGPTASRFFEEFAGEPEDPR
jgi:dCTP deaminase